jgi:Domain of unknown function (DUF4158)
MTSRDRTAYPRIEKRLNDKELEAGYTLSTEECRFIRGNSRGDTGQLSLAIVLKTRQQVGYFPLWPMFRIRFVCISPSCSASLSVPRWSMRFACRRLCTGTAPLFEPGWAVALSSMVGGRLSSPLCVAAPRP